MSRHVLAFYTVGVTGLIWLLAPGDWRALVAIPVAGAYGAWRASAPHPGRRAAGEAAGIPAADPRLGSMGLAEDEALGLEPSWCQVCGPTWRRPGELLGCTHEGARPWGGAENGGCWDGPPKDERWPYHDDPYGWPPEHPGPGVGEEQAGFPPAASLGQPGPGPGHPDYDPWEQLERELFERDPGEEWSVGELMELRERVAGTADLSQLAAFAADLDEQDATRDLLIAAIVAERIRIQLRSGLAE